MPHLRSIYRSVSASRRKNTSITRWLFVTFALLALAGCGTGSSFDRYDLTVTQDSDEVKTIHIDVNATIQDGRLLVIGDNVRLVDSDLDCREATSGRLFCTDEMMEAGDYDVTVSTPGQLQIYFTAE